MKQSSSDHNKLGEAYHMGVAALLCGLTLAVGIETVVSADNAPPVPNDPQMLTGLDWQPVREGMRLGTEGAVFVCSSSLVRIRSTSKFHASAIKWESATGGFLGTMYSEMFYVLVGEEKSEPERTTHADVVEVEGEAFYTKSQELKRKYKSPTAQKMPEASIGADKCWYQRYQNLRSIGWQPVGPDRHLGPWDVVWTQANGRVEIEILEPGEAIYVDESVTVVDPQGQLTNKMRLPPRSFLIIDPHLFRRANINKTLGEVLISRNHEIVKEFSMKYKTHKGLNLWTVPPWEEILKKQELE